MLLMIRDSDMRIELNKAHKVPILVATYFISPTSYKHDNVTFDILYFTAVFFLEFWKRKEITLAYQWDCLGYESEEERPRPTFAALAPTVERNPVTGILEPHFPDEKRKPRLFSGILIIVTMVMFVSLLFL